jgi:hypothetical protein
LHVGAAPKRGFDGNRFPSARRAAGIGWEFEIFALLVEEGGRDCVAEGGQAA